MNLFNFIPGYETAIYNTGREPAFILLLSFIVTYIITRGYTRGARIWGWGSTSVGGVHAHHMVFGLVIAFAAATLNFALMPGEGLSLLILAALFGCGMSLVLDEFALIFHLKDVYWEEEGRKSVDAVVLGIAFCGLLLMRVTPFAADANNPAWLLVTTILINLSIALIAGFKGKIFFALFGIFIPLVSLIGAIRLAEPTSIWFRRFYKKDSKKYKRSIKRYSKYQKTWRVRKEKIWDIIGGKTGRPVPSK